MVVLPEYRHLFDNYFYGDLNAKRIIFDVNRKNILNFLDKDWFYYFKKGLTYGFYKMNIANLTTKRPSYKLKLDSVLNKYGDMISHWSLSSRKFKVSNPSNSKINNNSVRYVNNFRNFVVAKKAHFILLPPVMQHTSFQYHKPIIKKLLKGIEKTNLKYWQKPEHYCFPDSLFFDSAYHPIKAGVDKRTDLVIKDIKRYIKENIK